MFKTYIKFIFVVLYTCMYDLGRHDKIRFIEAAYIFLDNKKSGGGVLFFLHKNVESKRGMNEGGSSRPSHPSL
jgi:hypothetical protein